LMVFSAGHIKAGASLHCEMWRIVSSSLEAVGAFEDCY